MNILIISRMFPPLNEIASGRPASWANYFAKKGHKVYILTVKKTEKIGALNYNIKLDKNIEIIEFIDAIFYDKKSKFKKFIDAKTRKLTGRLKASKLISSVKLDVVISTYGPEICHELGAFVKRKIPDIKWIADYRDLWTPNKDKRHDYKYKRRQKKEYKLVRNADLITTVSKPLQDEMQSMFPDKVVEVIFNGFEDKIFSFDEKKQKNIFSMTYTGTIKNTKAQNPSFLLEAIQKLKGENLISSANFKIDFYGLELEAIKTLIGEYKIHDLAKVHPQTGRDRIRQIQNNATMLVLIDPNKKNEDNGNLTGKIFEYISAGTPIINLTYSQISAPSKLLVDSGTGVNIDNSKEEIYNFLRNNIKNHCFEWFKPKNEVINFYTRDSQSKKMLFLLEK